MTLDESIKHEEEIANEYEKNAKHIREKMKSDIALSNADDLDKYAKNHRQIAGWLRELKTLKEHTGRWVKHDTGHSTYYDCSLCHCVATYTEALDGPIWKLSDYCPDCGARMESEVEE